MILGTSFGEMPCANVLATMFNKKTNVRFAYHAVTGTTLLLKKNGMLESVERKVESTFAWDRIGRFKLHAVNDMRLISTLLRNHYQLLICLEALFNTTRRLKLIVMYASAKLNKR